MKSLAFHIVWLFAMVAFVRQSNAQVINGIAINTLAKTNYTGAILDLSNQGANGSYGFLPPYVVLTSLSTSGNSNALTTVITGGANGTLSGLLVYNVNTSTANGLSGPGLYYWNSTLNSNNGSWVYLGTTGGTGAAANNGLSLSGTTIQLGGSNLIQTTSIPLNGYTLAATGSAVSTNFTSTGQVGIGNSSPNAVAVLDLTNTQSLGFMPPQMTDAQITAISLTAAQNGLLIFNTTTGCPVYACNGVWMNTEGVPSHGSETFSSSSLWRVPLCVTSLTIVAYGAAGGAAAGGATNAGGLGAVVTATVTVTPGIVLEIIPGAKGSAASPEGGGGGGGGTFIADNYTSSGVLVAAGGGGGGGYETTGDAGSTTTSPNTTINTTHVGGTNSAGTGTTAGGAGASWVSVSQSPIGGATTKLGGGGLGNLTNYGFPDSGGAGATDGGGAGGFGGGGGGGSDGAGTKCGGGGGGGGYFGGGGGNGTGTATAEYGGAGGGSGYWNGSSFQSPVTVTQTNTGSGKVIITW